MQETTGACTQSASRRCQPPVASTRQRPIRCQTTAGLRPRLAACKPSAFGKSNRVLDDATRRIARIQEYMKKRRFRRRFWNLSQ